MNDKSCICYPMYWQISDIVVAVVTENGTDVHNDGLEEQESMSGQEPMANQDTEVDVPAADCDNNPLSRE